MLELDEIWLLHESGICLFNYAVDYRMDPTLFGSFFTAINQFGQECAHNSIDDITMGENFVLSHKMPDYPLKIVGRSTKTKKRKEMKKMLQNIGEIFRSQYSPEDIIQFDGRIDKFDNFKLLVENFFNKQAQLVENFKAIF